MHELSFIRRLKAPFHPLVARLRQLASSLGPAAIRRTFAWFGGLAAASRARRREPRLTVAVDVSPFWEPLTGIGWYLYRIVAELARRDDVCLRLYGPHLVAGEPYRGPVVEMPAGPAIEWVRVAIPEDLCLGRHLLARLVERLRPLLVAADGNRVLFAPNFLLPRGLGLGRGALVATIHDLAYLTVPWTLQQETLERLSARMRDGVRRARRLITPSRAVAREIVAAGLAPAERVHAVHHGPGQLAGIEPGELPGELPAGVPASYALHVGTLEPRKNLGTVLAAWRMLHARGVTPPTLVFCGKLGWKSDDLASELATARSEGWLLHFGYVDNAALAALYRRASFVVLPSLYEGFGLPAVEAQLAGAPLVASDVPVLREVAGDGALFVPAIDPAAWATAIERLMADEGERAELVRRGLANAASLSWPGAAEATLAVFRAAAEPPP